MPKVYGSITISDIADVGRLSVPFIIFWILFENKEDCKILDRI